MVTYLVKRRFREPIELFLGGWGRALAGRFRVVEYEALEELTEVAAGICVFADLDRLDPAERAAAASLHAQLAGSAARPLNDPSAFRGRHELLVHLHELGVNRHRSHRASETRRVERFPVFVRYENEHWGAISPLLRSQRELDRALAGAALLHPRADDLLIVEFTDTRSPDGLYRKYSALVVDGLVLPRDLVFERSWMQKDIAEVTPETIAEERRYLEESPHAEELRRIARLAGVAYGRIDYGLLDGELQVWEANTNPILIRDASAYRPEHLANQALFGDAVCAAFAGLADECGQAPVPVRVERPVAAARGRASAATRAASRVGGSRVGRPAVRALELAVSRLDRPLAPLVDRRLGRPAGPFTYDGPPLADHEVHDPSYGETHSHHHGPDAPSGRHDHTPHLDSPVDRR